MNGEARTARWLYLAQLRERVAPAASAPAANGGDGLLAEFAARAADHLASLDQAARDVFLLRLVDAVDSAVEQRAELAGAESVLAGPPARRLTDEELEWAKGLYSEEEVLAGLSEIEQTGGLELAAFLPILEAATGPDE